MSRRFGIIAVSVVLVLALWAPAVRAAERFPTPEFESGYELPSEQLIAPAPRWLRSLDVFLFAMAIVLVAVFLHVLRSRLGVAIVAICSLAYFGFIRHGCICPVGSISNVARALLTSGPPVPWTVICLFAIPLVAAFFVGRAFCGGVCPLGAIQDVVLIRPVRVPKWLDEPLGLFRWFYLAAAIVVVYATGRFLICRQDPFVGFFRMNAPLPLFVIGSGLLIVSAFVGRVYCRYICPYGALLGLASRFSLWRVKVTPAECVKCGLCADACPFGAIRMYEDPASHEVPKSRAASAAGLLALTVVLVVAGGWLGRAAGRPWANTSYAVNLARQVWVEKQDPDAVKTLESTAFAESGMPVEALFELAGRTTDRFVRGAMFFGGFCGLVIGLKLFSLSRRRPPQVVEVDSAKCLSCGRCYRTCPIHRDRRRKGAGG